MQYTKKFKLISNINYASDDILTSFNYKIKKNMLALSTTVLGSV